MLLRAQGALRGFNPDFSSLHFREHSCTYIARKSSGRKQATLRKLLGRQLDCQIQSLPVPVLLNQVPGYARIEHGTTLEAVVSANDSEDCPRLGDHGREYREQSRPLLPMSKFIRKEPPGELPENWLTTG